MEIKVFTKLKDAFINLMEVKSSKKVFEDLSEDQKKLGSRIFDLVIGRVLKNIHAGLDEIGKANMEKVFLSEDEKAEGEFIRKNAPNFKELFEEEAKKINGEIAEEILKQTTV